MVLRMCFDRHNARAIQLEGVATSSRCVALAHEERRPLMLRWLEEGNVAFEKVVEK